MASKRPLDDSDSAAEGRAKRSRRQQNSDAADKPAEEEEEKAREAPPPQQRQPKPQQLQPKRRRSQDDDADVGELDLSDDDGDGRTGIVEMITLKNFMCHTSLEVSLNSNLNFIIGRNGSGKSAVMTALTVGLGGRARYEEREEGRMERNARK